MVNERLKRLALNMSAELIDHLNQMDDDTLKRTVEHYEQRDRERGNFLDAGVGQVLRMYQTARFIGRMANRDSLPPAG